MAFTGAYQKFTKDLLQGQVQIHNQTTPGQVQVAPLIVKVITEPTHKRVALRFIKTIPAIIGSDMKTYGPFRLRSGVIAC